MAVGIFLLCFLSVLVSVLTSNEITGAEGVIVCLLCCLTMVLSIGLADIFTQPYRRNKDDSPDDP